MKCYYDLYSLIEYDIGFADQKMYDDNSLNFLKMTTKNIESTKKHLKK
jgi:hypothetical protein